MKKFFSLVLALVMVMGLTTAAWGALAAMPIDGSSDDADGTVNSKIVLNDDVVLTSTYEVAGTLTIDLNGHTISGTDTTALYSLIHVKNGANLTIEDSVGTGKISYAAGTENKTGVAVWVEGALTLESGTIEITGDWVIGFAVDVRPNAWGTAYTEAASFTMDGGKIVASDSGVRVTSNSSDSYPNLGVTFTMNGGTIDSAYDGIFVQNVSYDDTLTVGVVGGTVTSENTHAVRIYGNSDDKVDVEMSITGGSFTGKMTNLDQTGTGEVAISGGTFTDDVSPYLASTAGFVTNPDGSVSVGAKATTGTYDLYSCNNTAVAAATGLSYTKVAAAPKTDGTGTIAYVAVDNGKNYMEISSFEATKADFYVTVSGSKTAVMYLREVSTVSYVASAKEFTNFGYGCGQYTKAYGDTSKYYQVLDGAYKNRVFRAETTGLGFLVDGKIVQLATEVTLNAHTWSATAVDTVTGVPTKAICGKCSTTGTVYASAAKVPAAAVIDVTALSYNNNTYPVVAGAKAVVGGTTGGKVESAETFDAGIAMYVGMSVMAAAGSAVVLKKRED